MEAEAARARRAVALEPVPAPDYLRYGGMTAAPLVQELFAGIAKNGTADENFRPFSEVKGRGAKSVGSLDAFPHLETSGGVRKHDKGGLDLSTHLASGGLGRTPRGNADHERDGVRIRNTEKRDMRTQEASSDRFLSSLDHHTRNVINVHVRVPPVGIARPLAGGNGSKPSNSARPNDDIIGGGEEASVGT